MKQTLKRFIPLVLILLLMAAAMIPEKIQERKFQTFGEPLFSHALPEGSKLMGYNTSQLIELPVMVTVMALMTLPALFKGKLRRWQGVALLGIYAAFVLLQVLIALKIV